MTLLLFYAGLLIFNWLLIIIACIIVLAHFSLIRLQIAVKREFYCIGYVICPQHNLLFRNLSELVNCEQFFKNLDYCGCSPRATSNQRLTNGFFGPSIINCISWPNKLIEKRSSNDDDVWYVAPAKVFLKKSCAVLFLSSLHPYGPSRASSIRKRKLLLR